MTLPTIVYDSRTNVALLAFTNHTTTIMYDSSMRQPRYRLNQAQTKQTLDALWEAAERSDKANTTSDFLRGVLTDSEQLQLGRRLLIAKRLLTGHSWSKIRAELGVSPNTIDVVQTWLSAQFPDYESVISDKQNRRADAKPKQRRTYDRNPLSWERLRKKYPGHFLLWNLLANNNK